MKEIRVKKVGEEPGFCREYFKCIDTGEFYAKQEDFKGVFVWYSTTKNYGEPECPIKEGIKFKVVEK